MDIVADTNLRMRVIAYLGSLDYCSITVGQIEDYTLNITNNSLSINENEQISISVYPNPVLDILTVSIPESGNNSYLAEVFSINGKLVYSKKIQDSISDFKIDVNNFTSGLYILKISNYKTSRIIKIIKL